MGRGAGVIAGLVLALHGVAPAATLKVGSFTKSTSAAPVAQPVAHGLGEVPKALVLWTDGKTGTSFSASFYFAMGFSDGTNSASFATSNRDAQNHADCSRRIAAKAITIVQWGETLLAEADLQSWDATNFTLNWTTNNGAGTGYVIHFLAIGGNGVSAKVVNWTMNAAAGTQQITGVGFKPTVVLHLHGGYGLTGGAPNSVADSAFGLGVMDRDGNQWANTFHSDNSPNKADTQRYQRINQTIVSIDSTLTVRKEASFQSMDTDGFTLNLTTSNSSQTQLVSLALAGVNAKAGSFTKPTTAAPASTQISGLSFRPLGVLLSSVQDAAQTTPQSETRFGVGATDGTTQGASALIDQDGANNMNVQAIDKTTFVFEKVNNNTPTSDAEATTTSLDAGGFTLGWSPNDNASTQVCYLALAPRRRVMVTGRAAGSRKLVMDHSLPPRLASWSRRSSWPWPTSTPP